jgi:hypothetical protein
MTTSIAAKFQNLCPTTHTFDIYTNPLKVEDYLIQDSALTFGYDTMNFGGDLGQEIDNNTWEGASNLVLIDWSLNIGRSFLLLGVVRDLVYGPGGYSRANLGGNPPLEACLSPVRATLSAALAEISSGA